MKDNKKNNVRLSINHIISHNGLINMGAKAKATA